MAAKQRQKDRGLIPGLVVSAQPKQFPARGEHLKLMALGHSPSSTEPMTNKPRRRTISATPTIRVPPEGGFWSTIATYATELAPIAGPLLNAIGNTANAIDRADRRNRSLEAKTLWIEGDWEQVKGGESQSQG